MVNASVYVDLLPDEEVPRDSVAIERRALELVRAKFPEMFQLPTCAKTPT
jgi:hypothetical protein